MAETTTLETDAPAPAETEETTPTPAADKLGEPGKAALEAERKARREADRQLKDALAKLQDIEDRDKSETQRLAEKAAVLEKTAAEAAAELARYKVAAIKGVPAELLTGTTPEEMEASADALLAFRAAAAQKLPTAPPATGQGNVGAPVINGKTQLTRADLAGMSPEAIVQAKSEGRLDGLLGIKTTP